MTQTDHTRISDAVHAAELGTAGEIVTILADRSDRYSDVALWWSVLMAILALAALAAFPRFWLTLITELSGGWTNEWSVGSAFELALAVVAVIFGLTRLIFEYWPLRLVLTPGIVKSHRVRARALSYFKIGAAGRTSGRTGILIFLSLAEHRAEIVADGAIHSKVAPEMWGEAMAKLIADVRHGRIADGMVAAIGDVGLILADHLPRADDDINELPDRLIEL
ncbi:MAG: TPM domain-containing protein [Sphingomonadaceae bacterium]